MMNNLPHDLVEAILSRVPLTSLRRVRSTCKKWNTLSKDESFTKKHLAQQAAASEAELLTIVLIDCNLNLMSVNLHNDSDPSIRHAGKLISLDDSYQLDMSRLCHCDGLLLCTTVDYTRLVVWNPYTGQARWICFEHMNHIKLRAIYSGIWYGHALGYDKSKSAYKILRYAHPPSGISVHEIYDLNSNSWRVLDVTPQWRINWMHYGLYLKGNIYWYAQDNLAGGDVPGFLICFDFTTERFVPRLPLPFQSYCEDTVILSCVRQEQLVVLFQNTYEMEIWVTTKIEPNVLSWSKFLAVDMDPLTGDLFCYRGSFLVDEEKRAVVVFDEDYRTERYIAYIIGQNDYFRQVDLGQQTRNREVFVYAVSYVPSSVQINQLA